MLAEAEETLRNPRQGWFAACGVAPALALLGLGVATLVVYRWRRRSRRRVATPADVVRLFESGTPPVLLDVRPPLVYRTSPFRLPGAIHVTREQLESGTAAPAAQPGVPVVTYGGVGSEREGADIAAHLRAIGYRDIRVLEGGLGGWVNAGLPLEAKPLDVPPADH